MTLNFQNLGAEFYVCTLAYSASRFPIVFTAVGISFNEVFDRAVDYVYKPKQQDHQWIELNSCRGVVELHGSHTDAMGRSIEMKKYSLIVPIGPVANIQPGSLEKLRAERIASATNLSLSSIASLRNSGENNKAPAPPSPVLPASRRRPSPDDQMNAGEFVADNGSTNNGHAHGKASKKVKK